MYREACPAFFHQGLISFLGGGGEKHFHQEQNLANQRVSKKILLTQKRSGVGWQRATSFGVCLLCPLWKLYSSGAETYYFEFHEGIFKSKAILNFNWTLIDQRRNRKFHSDKNATFTNDKVVIIKIIQLIFHYT